MHFKQGAYTIEIMKVVVGSTNPVKLKAVEEAFQTFFEEELEVVGKEVGSGVVDQPWGEEETRKGARNRAIRSLEKGKGDFGVGLEGGVTEVEGKLFECAWVVVKDRKGKEGLGGGLYFELPVKVAEKIRQGGELGPIMDELLQEKDVKKKSGAIGVFTKGKLTRKQAYVHLVLQALVKWGGWYE